ncbi:MAG TPA: GYF domain-containing protein [Polyangiaceae bacterium]|nr:GYF domain-containing protein [Polyangiaceae bacterium]
MNVACTACPAKYAVSDEKVRGKRARITCKHCGAHILVDGTLLGKVAPSLEPKAGALSPRVVRNTLVFLPGPTTPEPEQTAAPAPSWLVAFSEQRQEQATTDEFVELYAKGSVDADTYVWREGMTDWKTCFEIPELSGALHASGHSQAPVATQPLFFRASETPSEAPGESAAPPEGSGSFESAGSLHPEGPPEDAPTASTEVARAPGVDPAPQGAAQAQSFSYDDGVTIAREPTLPSNPIPEPPPSDDGWPSSRPAEQTQPLQTAGAPQPLSERMRQWPASPQVNDPHEATGDGPGSVRPVSQRAARRTNQLRRRTTLDDLFGTTPGTEGGDETSSPATEPDGARETDRTSEPGSTLGPEERTNTETSVSQLSPLATDPQRRTGARNENSVLFSLDALIRSEKPASVEPKSAPSSTELLLGPSAPSGGPPMAGLSLESLSSPMAAPDFMAPVRALPAPDLPSRSSAPMEVPFAPRRSRGRNALIAVLVFAAGVATAVALGLPGAFSRPVPSSPPNPEQVAGSSKAAGDVGAFQATAAEPPAPAVVPPAASQSATTPTSAPAPVGAATRRAETRSAKREDAATEGREEGASSKDAKTSGEQQAVPAAEAAQASAVAPAEAPTDLPAFDRAAAVEALTAAAANVGSCKQPDGPTGEGQVMVTFAASGRVTSASVSGALAGSRVGGCVAKLFRSARVPAFAGESVTVSKRFAVE